MFFSKHLFQGIHMHEHVVCYYTYILLMVQVYISFIEIHFLSLTGSGWR